MTNRLEVGQIVNTFGIKGFVKVKPFTDNIFRFDNLKNVYINQKQYEIEEVKYHKNLVLLKFKNIDKIEQAEFLKNYYLEIDRKDGVLEKGAYYIVDLIGLDVYTDTGELLGKLDDIYNTGSNDIYVVKTELGKQLLLPAIKDVIKEINLEEKKIIVHLLKGL
ncbi:MAG: 16S rRNA processing protein RimM [Clostridia bacterium]|nr:16S rRNA processing protein RimM [Clostridia bacterium]